VIIPQRMPGHMKMVWPKGGWKWCRGPRRGPPGNRGATRREQGLTGSDRPAPTHSRIPSWPRISPLPNIIGNGGKRGSHVIKRDGMGIEAAAGRLWSVLVLEPGCGGEGGSFASRQATALGDLGGPSRRLSDEVGLVCTQCLPKGSC
jgi:hypothetical protein